MGDGRNGIRGRVRDVEHVAVRGVGGSVAGVLWRVSVWPTAMVRTWPLVVY